MSGAGNDFVLIEGPVTGAAALARRLCDRRAGVGADGLLVMTRTAAGPRLDYRNADGSAAFCGNGSRCAALWAAERGWVRGGSFSLRTSRGALLVRLTGRGRAEVAMPEPRGARLGLHLRALGRPRTVHFVDAGAPHAVMFVPDAEIAPVRDLGRALRFHPAFGRAGANADFVELRRGRLILRTYERGVEDETLACGSGAVAAAFVARALGRVGSPVRLEVRSGATLTVSFDSGVRLEGPGEVVFTGEIE